MTTLQINKNVTTIELKSQENKPAINLDTTTSVNLILGLQGSFINTSNFIDNSFETVNKNLLTYPYSLNYTGEQLTSIVYDLGSGLQMTKSLNYTGEQLTSIVLTGNLPDSIANNTKNLVYMGEQLVGVSYS